MYKYQSGPLCTGYRLLLIANNFCDLYLLHWGGGGGQCSKKKFTACTVLPHSPPKLSYQKAYAH